MFKKGQEIIGKTEFFPKATYPAWALEVREVNKSFIRAVPTGGGFVKKIPLADAKEKFRAVTDEDRETGLAWKEAKFDIEGGPKFKGWHRGDNWNGWACPYFEKAEAEKILRKMEGWEIARYNEKADAFEFGSSEDEDELDVYKGEDVEINGKKMHLYPIGAYCWVWSLS